MRRGHFIRDVTKHEHLCCKGCDNTKKSGIHILAHQEIDCLTHFDGIPGRRAKNLIHVGQKRRGWKPGAIGDSYNTAGKLLCFVIVFLERTGAELNIHNKGLQSRCQLFRQDRRSNERNGFNGRCHIADGVKPFVCGGEVSSLTDDGTADLLYGFC